MRITPWIARGALALLIAVPLAVSVPGRTHASTRAVAVITRTVLLHPLHGSGVTGTAVFSYNPMTNRTTVVLTVKHLKAMSVHPAHIHIGSSCSANGPVIYPFESPSMGMTTAGRNGILKGITSFKGTFMHKAWYINVHTGPGLATQGQFKVLACGVV